MKIIFISNYYTHHQSEVSKSLSEHNNVEYKFIETEPMETERKNMGWELLEYPPYVVTGSFFEVNKAVCKTWIDDADIVIIGSAPLSLVRERIRQGKLTFIYSERIYKKPYKLYKLPIHFLKFTQRGLRKKNVYLLCASAYTSMDYSKTFTFVNKAYKWGYFPKTKHFDQVERMIEKKQPSSLLWVARLIDWKHPEVPVEVVKQLKHAGYKVELNILGNGKMEDMLKRKINELGVSDCVHLLGSMSPEEVRTYMEQSEIFLFTSDRNEGWGAVLNESMNSACAVIASHAIGAVPYLIEDGANGLIYRDGDLDDLYEKVKYLLDHPDRRVELSKNAYSTIVDEWNAENAAEKFLALSEELIDSPKAVFSTEKGVCSKAELLSDNWFIRRNKKCLKK